MSQPERRGPQPGGGRGASEPDRLERGYRRRLAWYPRWFRWENEEEILAVLLACAREGQARPSLEATADLLEGAARMWMRPRPGQWANGKGKNRGRAALAVFFGLDSLAVLAALSQDSITYAPADMAAGMVQCLIGLAAVMLVFNPASSRHYRREAPEPAGPAG